MDNVQAKSKAAEKVFGDWQDHTSGPRESTGAAILTSLRGRYPDWTVTTTRPTTGLLEFATSGHAYAKLDASSELFSSARLYKPAKGRISKKPGHFKDKVSFGKYDYTWDGHTFMVYTAEWTEAFRTMNEHYILSKRDESHHSGPAPHKVDELIAASAKWSTETHEEILVYDQQMWTKDKGLFQAVKSATWDDVILDKEMKKTLVTDVEGFFDCQEAYEEFAVPWKRGVIFHGTPGNGKTISIKALMHSLASRKDPIPTLYVKSLAGCSNAFYSIREIFVKARESAPCLLIFEDLDSLISDDVKSFFLNEVDGLEDNNGLMMIGSTNHLERLDAGISKRPSRFDRKYHFALPATPERIQYCDFWRSKLAKNKRVEFPEGLSTAIAEITEGFSFAYLKETFVTALLIIVGAQRRSSNEIDALPETNGDTDELKDVLIWRIISKQVQTLRVEMEDARKSAEEAAENIAAPNDDYQRQMALLRSQKNIRLYENSDDDGFIDESSDDESTDYLSSENDQPH